MRIIFAGNNERGERCLDYLSKQQNITIPLVICHPVAEEGYYKSISSKASSLGISAISPVDINSDEVADILASLDADLMLLVGYSAKILKKKIYSIPRLGTLNVHASLLPKYRGAAPLNWAMINGESECGVSIIEVDEGVDTGPILDQVRLPILPDDDIGTLTNRVNEVTPIVVMDVLSNYEQKKKNQVVQAVTDGFFCSKRKPKDGLLDFKSLNAIEVVRMVRALVPPYPGAFFQYKNDKITVVDCKPYAIDYRGVPGRIVRKDAGGIVILARDKAVIISSIIINDRVSISSRDYPFSVGDDINE